MLEDIRNSTSAGNDPKRTPEVDAGGGHFANLVLTTEGTTYDVFDLPNPNLGVRRFSYRTSCQAGVMIPTLTLAAMSLIYHRPKNHKT
jgi:hypothetical protein